MKIYGKKWVAFYILMILIVDVLYLPLYAENSEPSSVYKGSLAFNSRSLNEQVNRATGSLFLRLPVVDLSGAASDLPLQLTLLYSVGAASMYGAPHNWNYNLSFISNNQLFVGGKVYLIDPQWQSSKGYKSGLKYNNDLNIKFTKLASTVPLPLGKGSYRYRLELKKTGLLYYYDNVGKLLLEANKYQRRYLAFHYNDVGTKPATACLTSITDSWGQIVKLNYSSGKLEFVLTGLEKTPLNQSQRIISTIDYGPAGIVRFTDAENHQTTLQLARDTHNVNTIVYPNGLKTVITYKPGGIPYKNCEAGHKGAFLAVHNTWHTDGAGHLFTATEHGYGPNLFTGYPRYCLNETTDGLLESKDPRYYYTTIEVSEGSNLVKYGSQANVKTTFNTYHLPIVEERSVFTKDLNGLGTFKSKLNSIIETRITYNPQLFSQDKFRLMPAYSQPKIIVKSILSPDRKIIVYRHKTTYQYDNYAEPTLQQEFICKDQAHCTKSSDGNGWQLQMQIDTTYQPTKSGGEIIATQHIYDPLTKITKLYENTLDPSHNAIAQVKISINGVPWKTKSYIYDDEGRVTSEYLQWSDNKIGHPGITHSEKHYKYNYDPDTHIEQIESTDALGAKTQIQRAVYLQGMPIIKQCSPLGEVTTLSYNYLGQPLSVTAPDGEKITYSYTYAAPGQSFSCVRKTYANGYAQATCYDALGRQVSVKDNFDITTQSLQATCFHRLNEKTYFADGRLYKDITQNGNVTTTVFDSLNRLLYKKTAWGNIETNQYNDLVDIPIVTHLLNGYVIGETQFDAALRKVQQLSYPLDDKDNCVKSVKDITLKDGFNKVVSTQTSVKTTSGVEKPVRAQTYQYNGDGDIIHTTLSQCLSKNRANDQVPEKQTVITYDLLGNLLSKQTTLSDKDGKLVNSHLGPVWHYDEAGRLSSMAYYSQHKTVLYAEYYSYDADGQRIGVVYSCGDATTYHYDALGHIIKRCWTTVGEVKQCIDYEYDKQTGLLLSQTENRQKEIYHYFLDGTLQSITYPDGKQTSYGYNSAGQLTQLHNVFDIVDNYTYNHNNRLSMINEDTKSIVYDYTAGSDDVEKAHHVKGLAKSSTFKLSSDESGLNTNLAYDSFLRLNSISHTGMNHYDYTSDYGFDEYGRVISLKTHSTAASDDENLNLEKRYQYDFLGRLLYSDTLLSPLLKSQK